jgi:dTDP-4-dehydrorhamnose reductase
MIILLGASGYVGQAFSKTLRQRGKNFLPLSRNEIDYTRFDILLNLLRQQKPEFLINAAGYTGKPNVDACEVARADTLQGNTLFPQTVAHACSALNIPWGHVSSGCIYSGAMVLENGQERIEKDLTSAEIQKEIQTPNSIIQFRGFIENDVPNFSFRDGPCSFYSGPKALAEEAIAGLGQVYLWRLRIPFDEIDNPRNYLTKIQKYPKVYDNVNSLSHRSDFVQACLDLWDKRAPFGTYNVTNPGFVTTRQVVGMIENILRPDRTFQFWASDAEFYKKGAAAPRSNCVLDVSKLLSTGVKMRSVEDALDAALRCWKSSV